MVEENKHRRFTKEGHLDENSIAECAEWLNDPGSKLDPVLQKHLEKCSQCKSEVLEVSEIIAGHTGKDTRMRDQFEETCAAKHSPSIKPARRMPLLQAAAVLLVLVSITVIALLIKPGRTDIELAEQGIQDSLMEQSEELVPDSTEKVKQDLEPEIHNKPEVETDRYAANFIPNTGLEALIGVKYRGQNDPSLTSPPADTTLGMGFLKFIGSNPEAEKLELQVLNNAAEIIKKYPDIIELNITVELPEEPGIYYWKLSGEEELYFVGKITVKTD